MDIGGTCMKVLVMYYSRTGNTRKLAEAVANGVKEIDGITCTGPPDETTVRNATKLGKRVALLAKKLESKVG
jgi:menaquinone-dependent protoporphyrinogen IX oxidase